MECRESQPTAFFFEHVIDRLDHLVMYRQFYVLFLKPVMEITNQRPRQVLACGKASISIQTIDRALDVEDGVDPFYRLQYDRLDLMGGFALAHVTRDVCQFEELPAGMCPAQRTGRHAVALSSNGDAQNIDIRPGQFDCPCHRSRGFPFPDQEATALWLFGGADAKRR
jgi:hypothetical protein